MTIALRRITFRYGRTDVLHDITAQARPGRLTAVIGPNAAGKSTLLRCAAGLARPETGDVHIDDRPARRLRPRALARRVAYVAQRPTVSAAFSVRQVVELGRYALESDARKVDEALHRMELTALAHRPYPALSIGQQQRVSLARALAQITPSGNLVLDEPTSAMDLRHARRCWSILRQIADDGATVITALHDLAAAANLADDFWLLHDGRLVAAGNADDVMTQERLEAVFAVPFQWATCPDGHRILLPEREPDASSR